MPAPVKTAAPPPPPAARGCGLALSLTDLGRARPEVRGPLLKGKVNWKVPVRPNPDRPLDAAVEFECDLPTACAAADVLRDHDRAADDRPCRAWVRSPDGRWTRASDDVMLSLTVDGRPIPNPAAFGAAVEAGDLIAPTLRAARL